MTWQAEEATDPHVLPLRMEYGGAAWEQWFLLLSDVHWDNPHCDRAMLSRLLRQANERNAGILSFGDWFDAMGGKYDPRMVKDGVRPEHQQGNYLDVLVDDSAAYLEPYRQNLVMLADGNHETAIRKRLETDLTQRLAQLLGVRAMGYTGYVQFRFSNQGNKGGRSTTVLYYTHGDGGGGPVTRGVISTNRRAVSYPDANIVVSGHIHESWIVSVPRHRITQRGTRYIDEQVHVQLSTLKQEATLGSGYHMEKGRGPKPLGGAWLRFYWDRNVQGRIDFEVTRAK